MFRTVYAVCSHIRLGRPYYVLPVVAAAVSGYFSSSGDGFCLSAAARVCVVFLLLGMSSWAANEITDRDSDSRGRPKRRWGLYVCGGTAMLSSGTISVRSAMIYVVMLGTFGLVAAVALGMLFCGLSVCFLAIGLAYSVKPLRLKQRGVIGLAAVATAYGVLAFSAGWVAGGQSPTIRSLLLGCLLSVAFFGFEGIPHLLDHDQDSVNGESTIAVALGCETTRCVLAVCQCVPALALVSTSLLKGSSVLNLGFLLLAALAFLSACIAALTARCQEERLLALCAWSASR